MTAPTYLLVHGAWHGAWCWQRLGDVLDRRDAAWATIDLPSAASVDPAIDMRDDVKELRRVAKAHDLGPSDLVLWFERPRATLRTWLLGIALPVEGRVLDECARRLKLLARCKSFPVPYSVLKHERPDYIRRAFDAHHAGVP